MKEKLLAIGLGSDVRKEKLTARVKDRDGLKVLSIGEESEGDRQSLSNNQYVVLCSHLHALTLTHITANV